MFEKRLHTNTNTNTAHNMQKVKLIDVCGVGISHLTSTCSAVDGWHSLLSSMHMSLDHLTDMSLCASVPVEIEIVPTSEWRTGATLVGVREFASSSQKPTRYLAGPRRSAAT